MKDFIKVGLTALALGSVAGGALAASDCAAGKTIKDGVLTIATGNPAYFPWVIDDDPASGKGFEAAVALEIARRMGFEGDAVQWVRTTFDQAIQPGPKDYDFNLQQYSITEERDKFIDFSAPYYTAAQSVIVRAPTVEAGAEPTIASLKTLKWGAVESTTAPAMISELVAPEQSMLLYNDVADSVEALKANQVDAIMLDLPSALFTAAVLLDDGVVLGQFATGGDSPDQLGLVFEEGNPLRDCANEAIAAMAEDGTLADIEAAWLQEATGVPVIQ